MIDQQTHGGAAVTAQVGGLPPQTGPEFTGPADFASQAHQALLGWGQTLSDAEQRMRFERLAAVDDPAAFAKAAGQEMARHYMLLDAVALRFAWHIAQAKPEREDASKAGRWLDLMTKASREARRCLALAGELSQDVRAVGYLGKGGRDRAEDRAEDRERLEDRDD